MDYDYEISPEIKFVNVTGRGKYSIADIKNLVRIITGDKKYNPDFNSLIDIRRVTYTPVVSELMELSDFFILMKESFKSKVAIVVKSDLMYNLFKISSHRTNKNNIETNIFTDPDKAREWLNNSKI